MSTSRNCALSSFSLSLLWRVGKNKMLIYNGSSIKDILRNIKIMRQINQKNK